MKIISFSSRRSFYFPINYHFIFTSSTILYFAQLPIFEFKSATRSIVSLIIGFSINIFSCRHFFAAKNVINMNDHSLMVTSTKTQLRVLVVDDSRMCRKVTMQEVVNTLTSLKEIYPTVDNDIVFVQSSDGIEAVTAIQAAMRNSESFDFVLMDNIMHTMHGPEATRQIRALGYNGLIAFITGNVSEDDRKEAMAAGANMVLPKPFDRHHIVEILTAVNT